MLDETEAYGLTFRFPARDTAVGASLRDYGEFARPELDWLLAQAEADTGTFIDVGGHIGTISLPFAKARPGWRVITIEAAYPLANLIAEGAIQNGIPNVEVLSVAAGAEAGIAEFPAIELGQTGNFGAVGFKHPLPQRRRVGVRPLDDIAPDDTRLVKVDVEGFELNVLRGSSRLLETVRPTWLLETHRAHPQASRDVADVLRAHGYQLFWFFSPFATPLAPKGRPEDVKRGDFGLVALPPDRTETWELPPVEDAGDTPRGATMFRYLTRYGYRI